MKNRAGYESTRRLFRSEMKKYFRDKVPMGFKINMFLLRVFLPKRYYFFMQQVVVGYAIKLAFTRAFEWKMNQIINWQKQRQ